MHAPRCAWPRAIAAGMALWTIGGCYSYPPHGYSQPGNSGYYSSPPPGVYSQPGPYSQPGVFTQPGPYSQPGGYPPAGNYSAPGQFTPGGTLGPGTAAPPDSLNTPSGTPTYGNTQPFQPSPIEGGPGEPFRPNTTPRSTEPFSPDPRGRAPVENLTPAPRDLDPAPREPEPFSSGPANFGTRPGDERFTPPRRTTPTNTPRRTLPADDTEPFGSDSRFTPENFEAPAVAASRPVQPLERGPELKAPNEIVVASGVREVPLAPRSSMFRPGQGHPHPHAYDRDGFSWVRGTVDFDEEDGSWFIIYNLKPDEHDPYQGGLTMLGTTQQFGQMSTGDVVLVEGVLDPANVDARNAPTYRVAKVTRLKSGNSSTVN